MTTQTIKEQVLNLLDNNAFRVLPGGKQLTLAFGGIYLASTTRAAKAKLVWETEKSYPRYYVPVQSLHIDVQALLDGRPASSNMNLRHEGTFTGTLSPHPQANIEKLAVGGKTLKWVRFLNGPMQDYIRFERSELDAWFEDGKISAGIRNPFKRIDTAPVSHHIVVKVDGEVVAETDVAVALFESGLSETFYLPATSIKDWSTTERSDLRTACPYKGEAWYLSMTVKGKKHENLIWYYQYPTHESAGIEGLISFYRKDFVEVVIDGVPL